MRSTSPPDAATWPERQFGHLELDGGPSGGVTAIGLFAALPARDQAVSAGLKRTTGISRSVRAW
jgi:hypothetical protein